jgi:WD40 repeat protein
VREITSDQYAPITSVRFASDGKRLLAGSWDQTVRVYDLEAPDRDPVVRSLTPEEGYRAVNSVAWSPDGAAMPIRSAEISLTAHRVEAGHVSGVTSSSVGTEIDAMLAFPVGRHLTMTLAASHFRGGRFYREATGSEPSVNYAYAGFEFRF